MTSWNLNDLAHGYCGHCHDFTGNLLVDGIPIARFANDEKRNVGIIGAPDAGKSSLVERAHQHTWVYHDDEYGSLADGGSYEVYLCSTCGDTKYVQLPD
jgi:hypothetical protein